MGVQPSMMAPIEVSLWAARTVLLVVHGSAFSLLLIGALLAPNKQPAAVERREATLRKVGFVLEYLTGTLCHLTVCSQGILTTYLALVQTGAVEAAAMMAVVVMP